MSVQDRDADIVGRDPGAAALHDVAARGDRAGIRVYRIDRDGHYLDVPGDIDRISGTVAVVRNQAGCIKLGRDGRDLVLQERPLGQIGCFRQALPERFQVFHQRAADSANGLGERNGFALVEFRDLAGQPIPFRQGQMLVARDTGFDRAIHLDDAHRHRLDRCIRIVVAGAVVAGPICDLRLGVDVVETVPTSKQVGRPRRPQVGAGVDFNDIVLDQERRGAD